MEILNWILSAFSVFCTAGTIITIFMYRKQAKRFKTAEAFEKEVVALKATVESLQGQLSFYDGRLNEMQKLVIGKDTYIAQLTADKHTLEVKHAKNKSAINKAYECQYCDNKARCPVLMQRAANEEAYLQELNKE